MKMEKRDAARIRSKLRMGAKIQKAGLEFINIEIGRCKDKGATFVECSWGPSFKFGKVGQGREV